MRTAQLSREARLRFGVEQRPHHQPALCARAVPDSAPSFCELLTVLSFCAAATAAHPRRHGACYAPMRDPFWLAKQAATIDQLSSGRPGAGAWRRRLSRRVRRPGRPGSRQKARRGEMMDEGLELMRRLFTERRVPHEGKYYAVRGVEMCYPQAQGRSVRAVGRRVQYGDRRARRTPRHRADCPAGGSGRARGAASRN